MKIQITPPSLFRQLEIQGLVAALPAVQLPTLNLASIDAWLHVQCSPNGAASAAVEYDNGVATLADATGSIYSGGDGIDTASLLLLTARRKAGAAGAIAAQTVRLAFAPRLPCTADATADTFSATGHGLVNGQAVRLVTGTMPTGITANTDYFVINATETTWQLSATRGGSAINFTTAGTGLFFSPGEIEIARIRVGAASAGTDEPLADYVVLPFTQGDPRFATAGTWNLRFGIPTETSLEVVMQLAGN